MGSKTTRNVVSVAAAPFTGGASLLATTYVEDAAEKVGGAITGSTAMRKAAKQQEAQAQALIKEQENAAAAEKAKANAARRSTFANKSETNYSSTLGEFASNVSQNVRKKTLLGG